MGLRVMVELISGVQSRISRVYAGPVAGHVVKPYLEGKGRKRTS